MTAWYRNSNKSSNPTSYHKETSLSQEEIDLISQFLKLLERDELRSGNLE